jgi:putative FmdB family regulatory protein
MYEYRCRDCGAEYEQLRRMQEADRDLECPECGAKEIDRLISGFATGGSCGSGSSGGFV